MLSSKSVYKARIFIAITIGFALSGCSSTSELLRESAVNETVDADYSIIYYIHADSDYLYHNSNGDPIRGNAKVLQTAYEVAEGAKSGEVFIFYQRPEKKLLGLFPRRSSQFYHYVNGELTGRVTYRHSNKSEDFLTTEAQLYQQYRNPSRINDQDIHFLYFGHEIPLEDGKKYHQTLSEIDVNMESFSRGMQKFLAGDEQRFDLLVLSTCNNGSPVMAQNLMPISDTVLASPQNLHLSHIDSGSLGYMESTPEISSLELAQTMAEKTYTRLESEIMTAITLTVYDFNVVRNYREELQTFVTSYENLDPKPFYTDNHDCNQVDFFNDEQFSKGIFTRYKPARFGRKSLTTTHSGWGCKPLIQD